MKRNIWPIIEIELFNGDVIINDPYIFHNLNTVKKIQNCLRITSTYTVYLDEGTTFVVDRDSVRFIRNQTETSYKNFLWDYLP